MHMHEVGQQFLEVVDAQGEPPVVIITAQTHRGFTAPMKIRGTPGPPKWVRCTALTYTVQGGPGSRFAPSDTQEIAESAVVAAVNAGVLTPIRLPMA